MAWNGTAGGRSREWIRLADLVQTNRRLAGRLSHSAVEYRSHRSDSRIDRRDGGISRKSLPALARFAAKRLRCRAAPHAAPLVLEADHRPLPAVPRIARPPALTTDVIVGFPGETEADFAETCRVVREIGFSKIHQFPFSPRRGTPAAEMPDQVPPAGKNCPLGTACRIGDGAARFILHFTSRPRTARADRIARRKRPRQNARHGLSLCAGGIDRDNCSAKAVCYRDSRNR